MKRAKNGKPMIRHCKNCAWYCGGVLYDCQVKYIDVLWKRLRALLCRFYKCKED